MSNKRVSRTPQGKASKKEQDLGEHYVFDLAEDSHNKCVGGSMRKSMSLNNLADFQYEDVPSCSHNSFPTGSTEQITQSKTAEFINQRDYTWQPGAAEPTCLGRTLSMRLKPGTRTRRYGISQQEKEQIEYEEMKKFKIKPLPLPKYIVKGIQPEIPEIKKKKEIKIPEIAFKARPAPKHILEKADIPVRLISKPLKQKLSPKPKSKADKLHRSGSMRNPQPFSFLEADAERQRRKEQRIQFLIEQEKKLASSFRANPLPGGSQKRMYTSKNKAGPSNVKSKENMLSQPTVAVLSESSIVPAAKSAVFSESEVCDKLGELEIAKEEEPAKPRELLAHCIKPITSYNNFKPEAFSSTDMDNEDSRILSDIDNN